jgi:cell wall-associated NlpC family hydrolase
MLMRPRALPKALGVFLVAATINGALPQAATAAPSRATLNESVEAKGPKKRKRPLPEPVGFESAHKLRVSPWTPREKTPAEIAVAAAGQQVGKPYRWGSAGPRSFDCSGLTRFAWAEAGVHLPHSSADQYRSYEHVSLGELRPGDIVYSPGHVGIYIGGGKMIHSPRSGETVEVAPLHGNARGGSRPT